jgi:kynurenine formamidase
MRIVDLTMTVDECDFVREHPGVAELPVENMISDAVVLDLSFRGQANARITPEDLERAELAPERPGTEARARRHRAPAD